MLAVSDARIVLLRFFVPAVLTVTTTMRQMDVLNAALDALIAQLQVVLTARMGIISTPELVLCAQSVVQTVRFQDVQIVPMDITIIPEHVLYAQ